MMPLAIVTLIAGGAVVGAFLKLFSDHRAFRRQLAQLKEEQDILLDIVSTAVALPDADSARIARIERKRKPE